MAEATLKKMGEKLESSGKGPEICKKTKAIFCFDLKDAGKWTLDLKNEGKLCKGEAGKADCTITMKDADFLVTFLKVSYCKATVQFRRWLLLAAPVFQHTHWLDSHGCSSASTNRSEQAMVAGKLNGQQAFMQGKLKLKGNMMLAQKLGTVLASLK